MEILCFLLSFGLYSLHTAGNGKKKIFFRAS